MVSVTFRCCLLFTLTACFNYPLAAQQIPRPTDVKDILTDRLRSAKTPEAAAQAFWKTVLLLCTRPGASATSYFYSILEKRRVLPETTSSGERLGDGVSTRWAIIEYQAPFYFSPVQPMMVNEDESHDLGVQWRTVAIFQARLYRTIELVLVSDTDYRQIDKRYSHKTEWSQWGQPDGPMLKFNAQLQKTGLIWEPAFWYPTTCDVVTAKDPFAEFSVPVEDKP
jgi:hypothetical protein